MNTYTSGSLVTSAASFTNNAGQPTDPDTVTLKYKLGNGATQTVVYPASPIVKNSVGNYQANFDTTGWTGPGMRLDIQQWQGTGAVVAIADDAYQVEPSTL